MGKRKVGAAVVEDGRRAGAAKHLGAKGGLTLVECDRVIHEAQNQQRKEFLKFMHNEDRPPGVRDVDHVLFLYGRFSQLKQTTEQDIETEAAEDGST